jgi:hypothetical protein
MQKINAGDIFKTNEGGSCLVIQYNGCYDVTIEHMDKRRHRAKVVASQLRDGRIKNPYMPRISGIGFIGYGRHKASEKGRDTHAYTAWSKMLERAYCEKKHKTNKSYIGCSVADEWHNFQIFSDWYEQQEFKGAGYQLDKDVLCPGNKVYGPSHCRFIPDQINKLFNSNKARRASLPVGVTAIGRKYTTKLGKQGGQEYIGTYDTAEEAFAAYKAAREGYVRWYAEKFRGAMPSDVYEAICRYTVNIDD